MLNLSGLISRKLKVPLSGIILLNAEVYNIHMTLPLGGTHARETYAVRSVAHASINAYFNLQNLESNT